MWVNGLLIAVSAVLLVYWFRYTCLLILSVRCSRNYAVMVAEANALRFPEIEQALAQAQSAELAQLDALHVALARDYELLTCLFRHGAEFRMAGRQLEHRMLVLDFQVMRAWYAISRRLSIPRGQVALQEMVNILYHFADMMGECTASAQ
jgi:hypothetical protein